MNILKHLLGMEVETTRDETEDRIRHCPWKEDIAISRSSFIGSGEFDCINGKAYHDVYIAADGPNPDGKTFHHILIGYWDDFVGFDDANAFAVEMHNKILALTGYDAPIYCSGKDKNAHARWCMNGRKKRPKGARIHKLPTNFKAYEY